MRNIVQARINGNPAPKAGQTKCSPGPVPPTTEQLHHFEKLDADIQAAGALLALLAEKSAEYRQQLGVGDDDGLSSGFCALADNMAAQLATDYRTLLASFPKTN